MAGRGAMPGFEPGGKARLRVSRTRRSSWGSTERGGCGRAGWRNLILKAWDGDPLEYPPDGGEAGASTLCTPGGQAKSNDQADQATLAGDSPMATPIPRPTPVTSASVPPPARISNGTSCPTPSPATPSAETPPSPPTAPTKAPVTPCAPSKTRLVPASYPATLTP